MPIYEYRCAGDCPRFELTRPMEQRNEPAACPHCGGKAEKLFVQSGTMTLVPANFRRFERGPGKTVYKDLFGSGPWEKLAYPKWDKA